MRRLADWRVIVCCSSIVAICVTASITLQQADTTGSEPTGTTDQTALSKEQGIILRVAMPAVVTTPIPKSISTPEGRSVPTPTPTPSLELTIPDILLGPKITPTSTPTRQPTRTPIPTKTPKPTSTPIPRPTLTPTGTPLPTLTPTPTSLPTRTPTPTNTPPPERPSLTIPKAIPAVQGHTVAVPITFDSDGANVSSITFSVDYDESCLSFDSADANEDGLPDSVQFMLPAIFGVSMVGHDIEDTDGEIDFTLVDSVQPFEPIPEGVLVEITLTVKEVDSCRGTEADVGFSSSPQAGFANDEGERLDCETEDGKVLIAAPPPDPTSTPTPTATPTYTPTPVPANPSLTIPDAIAARPGQKVTVPITLDSDGANISGVSFSLQYDRSCLSFDPTDDNSDGLPDSVRLFVPSEFDRTLIAEAPEDSDREIDFVLADLVFPLASMSDGVIAEIRLNVAGDSSCWGATVDIKFWADTPATYFDTDLMEVTGTTRDGSVRIAIPTPTFTPTPTATHTHTPTPTFTPTPTPTFTPTHTPTLTPTPTQTPTSTPTPTAIPEPELTGPSLTIPADIPGMPGQTVIVPITFDDDDNAISALTFSVDFDQTCLSFDPVLGVAFKVPPSFITLALYDSGDADGEIDFTVYNLNASVEDGVIVELTFTVSADASCHGATADVAFSNSPSAVFGDNQFRPVQGWTQDGSVKIADS